MVLSRALSLAAVTLLVGCCAMGGVEAQENLDAGKNPSQIFSGTCTACHKSARGLLKTVAPGSLQGFLRQHYTTSPEMAGALASYLISNGAADTRYGDKRGSKDGKEAKSDAKQGGRTEAAPAQGEAERPARGKRAARPTEPAEVGRPAAEEPAVTEHGSEPRKGKQRLGKRGKTGVEEETPKTVEPAKDDAAGGEPAKSDTATVEPAKPEPVKPEPARSEPVKPEPAAKPEAVKSEPVRTEQSTRPVENAKPAESPPQSATADAAKTQVNEALPPSLRPDPVPPVPPVTPAPSSPSVTVSAPPPPPAEPATPPQAPISH